MLAVDREHGNALFPDQRHNNITACNKRLFIGKSDILAAQNCVVNWNESGKSDYGTDTCIAAVQRRTCDVAFFTGQDFNVDSGIFKPFRKLHCLVLINYGTDLGSELFYLIEKCIYITAAS